MWERCEVNEKRARARARESEREREKQRDAERGRERDRERERGREQHTLKRTLFVDPTRRIEVEGGKEESKVPPMS